MIEERTQAWREYGFLLLLILLCTIIAVLQFRWTGELARAEFDRLGGNQGIATQQFCDAYDLELSSQCELLTPAASEMNAKAIAAKVKRWQTTKPRPVFKRLGLVFVKKGALELQMIDLASGIMSTAEWPAEWNDLRLNLIRKLAGRGAPPYWDKEGLTVEFPIRGGGGWGGGAGPPQELGWMIYQVDRDYLIRIWLPELTKRFLNHGKQAFYRLDVIGPDGKAIFSHGPAGPMEKPLTLDFNYQGHSEFGGGGMPHEPMWSVQTRRQTGALEKLVATSRQRNLAIACCVNGLILAAGFALVRQTRKSRLLAEAQMSFVANVSHELRTPVTVILGAAHNLKRGIVKSPESLDRYAGMILQHTQQLSDMVQEVLEFSAAKRGKQSYQYSAVGIGEVLRQALEDTKIDVAEHTIEWSVDAGLPKVSGDFNALLRAMRNLISNAAKHGGSGNWIGISAKLADGRIVIDIADHGAGIPRSEQVDLFKPFFRGTGAHVNQVRGSGLGLGLVKEIVEAHGGRISVSSEEGKGAIFTVSLPVINENS